MFNQSSNLCVFSNYIYYLSWFLFISPFHLQSMGWKSSLCTPLVCLILQRWPVTTCRSTQVHYTTTHVSTKRTVRVACKYHIFFFQSFSKYSKNHMRGYIVSNAMLFLLWMYKAWIKLKWRTYFIQRCLIIYTTDVFFPEAPLLSSVKAEKSPPTPFKYNPILVFIFTFFIQFFFNFSFIQIFITFFVHP